MEFKKTVVILQKQTHISMMGEKIVILQPGNKPFFRQSNSDSISVLDENTIKLNTGASIPDTLGMAMAKADELGWKDWVWKSAKKQLVRTAFMAGFLFLTDSASAQVDAPQHTRFVGYSMYGDSLFAKCVCPPKPEPPKVDTITAAKPIQVPERPAHWPKSEPIIIPIQKHGKTKNYFIY